MSNPINDVKTKPWEMERPSADDMRRFFCELQSMVWHRTDPESKTANDCFCGHAGLWPNADHPGRVYDGTPENGFRNTGEAAKAIYEAVKDKFDPPPPDYSKMPTTVGPRRYWVANGGHCVLSNHPVLRGTPKPELITQEWLLDRMADAGYEWSTAGGFIVCESCTPDDALRIAELLNQREFRHEHLREVMENLEAKKSNDDPQASSKTTE